MTRFSSGAMGLLLVYCVGEIDHIEVYITDRAECSTIQVRLWTICPLRELL